MTREQALKVVIGEREYQERTFDPNEVMSSGVTRGQRDLDVTSHMVLLDAYVEKAKSAWVPKGSNLSALQQIAKVAAIALRALERAGGSEELLVKGLR